VLASFSFHSRPGSPDPLVRAWSERVNRLSDSLYRRFSRTLPSSAQIFFREIWILFTLVAVFSGDTAAFYIGRAWGRKSWPLRSARKTVEGGTEPWPVRRPAPFCSRDYFSPAPLLSRPDLGLGAGLRPVRRPLGIGPEAERPGQGFRNPDPGHGGLLTASTPSFSSVRLSIITPGSLVQYPFYCRVSRMEKYFMGFIKIQHPYYGLFFL